MDNQQKQPLTPRSLFIKGLLMGVGVKLIFSFIFTIFFTAVLTPFLAFGDLNDNATRIFSDNATAVITIFADIIAMTIFLYFYHRKNKNNIMTIGAFAGWIMFLIIHLITIAF